VSAHEQDPNCGTVFAEHLSPFMEQMADE